jgi:hypothetical protein
MHDEAVQPLGVIGNGHVTRPESCRAAAQGTMTGIAPSDMTQCAMDCSILQRLAGATLRFGSGG